MSLKMDSTECPIAKCDKNQSASSRLDFPDAFVPIKSVRGSIYNLDGEKLFHFSRYTSFIIACRALLIAWLSHIHLFDAGMGFGIVCEIGVSGFGVL